MVIKDPFPVPYLASFVITLSTTTSLKLENMDAIAIEKAEVNRSMTAFAVHNLGGSSVKSRGLAMHDSMISPMARTIDGTSDLFPICAVPFVRTCAEYYSSCSYRNL